MCICIYIKRFSLGAARAEGRPYAGGRADGANFGRLEACHRRWIFITWGCSGRGVQWMGVVS